MEEIKTSAEYKAVMTQIEGFVKKAESASGFDNLHETDLEIFKELSAAAEKYENETEKIYPFEGRNPLIVALEEEMFKRRMKQREFAEFLGISDSRLSDIIRGKASISINVAKSLHSKLGIDGNIILENI